MARYTDQLLIIIVQSLYFVKYGNELIEEAYFLCYGDHRIAGRIEESPLVMEAKMFLFDFEHDVVVDVSDSKASICEGHKLSNNGKINRIGKAILLADNGNRIGIHRRIWWGSWRWNINWLLCHDWFDI